MKNGAGGGCAAGRSQRGGKTRWTKKMKSLLFDDGYESFAVNDDPTRIIRFNPADPEIINRVLDVQRHFKDYSPPEGIELNPDGTPKSDMERTVHTC